VGLGQRSGLNRAVLALVAGLKQQVHGVGYHWGVSDERHREIHQGLNGDSKPHRHRKETR
jgi:hypothetical protein